MTLSATKVTSKYSLSLPLVYPLISGIVVIKSPLPLPLPLPLAVTL
ncbi:MAG: hypothetical protein HRT52_13860 [Colwellia sp.]|nr:hypothetical protein [Colwellia sp.]